MGNKFCSQLLLISTLLLFSCAKKSDVSEARGDVNVKIGIQTSASDYSLQIVQLKGIEKLNEVAGSFVRFFFAPGSSGSELTGGAPRAQFIHSGNYFVPSDMISLQMASIYYHMQNLAEFDKVVGADQVNQWPRSVGLETQILDSDKSLQQNNAFYNGQTDSMMFVPYTKNNIPIAVNAGIIAHEHFHSLFYKLVIRAGYQTKKLTSSSASIHSEEDSTEKISPPPPVLTDANKLQMRNETLLRGMNEGFADFWGWVYTNDPEFMRWSLPEYQADRTLTLSEDLAGRFETADLISNQVDYFILYSKDPKGALVKYSYQVGTPYARFLKQLSHLQVAAKNISLSDSKKIVSQLIFNYIKDLGAKQKTMQVNESLDPLSLFEFVAQLAEKNELIRLDQKSCEFLVKYFNFNQVDHLKLRSCKEQNAGQKGQKESTSFVVIKP